MYRLRDSQDKKDPVRRWALPERVFFACGACHILTHAFISTYPEHGYSAVWIRPKRGLSGNHIVSVRDDDAFDYHSHSNRERLLRHFRKRANQFWPDWDCDLVDLPMDVLISEHKSRSYEGLWLREPKQFHFDATPRALSFLRRFSPPRARGSNQATEVTASSRASS